MKTIKDIKAPGHAGMRAGLRASVARNNPTKENIKRLKEAQEELAIVKAHALPDFNHLNRMQKRIMAADSIITEKEFRSEPAAEQWRYYDWMCKQCGELADLI